MRYFIHLSYRGTNYFGWQIQPQDVTIQGTIESALSTILNSKISITGCGRTDTGVHAKQYVAHFDNPKTLPEGFLPRLNKFLPKDIAIHSLEQVHPDKHARFDAYHRAYEYHLDFEKNPFGIDTAYYFYAAPKLDIARMQEACALLMTYEEFFPFCKTHHDAKTLICHLTRCEWVVVEEGKKLVFHIAANRFLRGMVRLIVGMSLNVGLGKISIAEVKAAMDEQRMLEKSLSVPAHGLYLRDIRYPE